MDRIVERGVKLEDVVLGEPIKHDQIIDLTLSDPVYDPQTF